MSGDTPAAPVSITEIEQFFYIARRHGYVDPTSERYPSPHKPGFKYTVYRQDRLSMIDEWCANPDPIWSSGQTTIWFDELPVWQLIYWGIYTKEAAKFLKEALRESYADGVFYNGRGRPSYRGVGDHGNPLIYRNAPKYTRFDTGQGFEDVTDLGSQKQLGYHHYRVICLLQR